ncbi:MAG: 4-hydroxy-tetrahydrodipicolinate synthase [Parcubacteria group bacterium RIFCSPLOWO2_01_FULL_48_18]|nr:MAG: 4-hydroxy-tetrahydrodipicolinate synthase [Parcubacteria group bacterium RIFCSPLOWO2_01_FULL_48_18]OHB23572.1 MAG: 4-hydroxy-tetrahydrodipicolinate synthase [Parcubacteria group bacterium RIFCSPHIGHO2_02_FULL_48_10b]
MNLEGTFTAIVTPFHEDGSIDYDSFARLIEDQIKAGISGIVVLGTTGESPTISPEEHNRVIKFAIEKAAKRTLVIAGTGSNSTDEAIEYSVKAKEDGADALLLVSPYYNKPTQKGLYEHFKKIADSVDLPQIIYNIKGRTAVNVETDTLMKLAEHKNIVAVKEASGDISQMMDVLMRAPKDFTVISGDDNITFPLMCLGGKGVISVVSNIVPADVIVMVNAVLRGDFDEARKKHFELLPLMKACFIETNPIPIKTMLAMQGKIKESFRLPMCAMEAGNKEKLRSIFSRYQSRK